MTDFTFTMLQIIKDVAFLFHTKCSKYDKSELTQELQDILYKEALNEVVQIKEINKK